MQYSYVWLRNQKSLQPGVTRGANSVRCWGTATGDPQASPSLFSEASPIARSDVSLSFREERWEEGDSLFVSSGVL